MLPAAGSDATRLPFRKSENVEPSYVAARYVQACCGSKSPPTTPFSWLPEKKNALGWSPLEFA